MSDESRSPPGVLRWIGAGGALTILLAAVMFPPSMLATEGLGGAALYLALVATPGMLALPLALRGWHWWNAPLGLWAVAIGFIWRVDGEESIAFGVLLVAAGLTLMVLPVVRSLGPVTTDPPDASEPREDDLQEPARKAEQA